VTLRGTISVHPCENTHTHIVELCGYKPFRGDNERLPADCNLSAALGE